MAIVYQQRPDRGVTYVYESESYYDPEKKQSRSKRKLIGKVDPETGEVIPTGKQGRRKRTSKLSEAGHEASAGTDGEKDGGLLDNLAGQLEAKEKEIQFLKSRIAILEKDNEKLKLQKSKAEALLKVQSEHLAEAYEGITLTAGKIKEILSVV